MSIHLFLPIKTLKQWIEVYIFFFYYGIAQVFWYLDFGCTWLKLFELMSSTIKYSWLMGSHRVHVLVSNSWETHYRQLFVWSHRCCSAFHRVIPLLWWCTHIPLFYQLIKWLMFVINSYWYWYWHFGCFQEHKLHFACADYLLSNKNYQKTIDAITSNDVYSHQRALLITWSTNTLIMIK